MSGCFVEHRRDVYSRALCAGATGCTGGGSERARYAGLPAERTGEAAQAVAAAGRDRYHSGRRQDQTSETAAHGEANFRSCISKLGTDATSMKRALSMGAGCQE